MKLAHAIRVGRKLADVGSVSSEDKIAITVLVRFAERVLAARVGLRALHGAVFGDEELNQSEISFDSGGKP